MKTIILAWPTAGDRDVSRSKVISGPALPYVEQSALMERAKQRHEFPKNVKGLAMFVIPDQPFIIADFISEEVASSIKNAEENKRLAAAAAREIEKLKTSVEAAHAYKLALEQKTQAVKNRIIALEKQVLRLQSEVDSATEHANSIQNETIKAHSVHHVKELARKAGVEDKALKAEQEKLSAIEKDLAIAAETLATTEKELQAAVGLTPAAK